MSLNLTYRYVDDVLSINHHNFHNYVHLIYPEALDIKDSTETDISASYLDILLNIDSNGRLTATLYDKRDDFNFAIVNFPFLCSNIPLPSAYGFFVNAIKDWNNLPENVKVERGRIDFKRNHNTKHIFLMK